VKFLKVTSVLTRMRMIKLLCNYGGFMISDEFRDDIKLFFDGLRNIAICVALVTGLPIIERVTPLVCDSTWLKFSVTSFSIGMIISLYILNLVWLHVSFKQEPTSKFMQLFGFTILLLLITIATGTTVFINTWPQIYIYA
jgi:hypothetical protein